MNAHSHTLPQHRKANDGNQRQIPIMGEARRPCAVPDDLIGRCESMRDAIKLCVHLSSYPHDHICSTLGINNGHWTRIMQGKAHFPPNLLQPLCELCGNLAPLQFWMAQNGLRIPAPLVGMREAEAA